MGTGTSRSPTVGVPLNPRVDYADTRTKKEGKTVVIDQPILVELQHGTVRYRSKHDKEATNNMKSQREHPHEGPERSRKHGYFFHARLNDFSEDAEYNKEEPWKFSYVYQGPENAKKKKLYYVFGKGLQAKDQGVLPVQSVRPQGQGYQWPNVYKLHGHVYFDLYFLKQDAEIKGSDDEDADDVAAEESPDAVPQPIQLTLKKADKLDKLRRRLAVRLIKPQGHIHIYHQGRELRPEEKISGQRKNTDGKWKKFLILLKPK